MTEDVLTEEEFYELLHESGVANPYGHYENGKLQTAITSIDELRKFADLVYGSGISSCYY